VDNRDCRTTYKGFELEVRIAAKAFRFLQIQLIYCRTGSILASTADFEVADRQALLKSGPIRLSCVDSEFVHLATVGDDKKLKVWQIEGLKILSERCV
jgi:hypothetical protein